MQECGVVPRVWEQIQPVLIKNNEKQPMIRLCSYNVLCQETIEKTMHLYQHTRYDESCLYWEQRWRGLAKNLEQINADIFGSQEVQESHFWSHFSPFMRRTQLVRLRCKTTKKEILVANTHIVFNPKRGDIKLAQIAILLAHIDKELKMNGAAPVFILGDFNLHPKSDIYKFLLSSRLCCDSLTRNKLSGTSRDKRGPPVFASRIMPSESGFIEGNELTPIEENVLTHPFKLESAYEPKSQQGVKGKGVSTYHAEVGNPDFIFYSVGRNGCSNLESNTENQSIRLIRRMSLPTRPLLRSTLGPWPNRHVPSDHIPIVAEFQLLDGQMEHIE